MSNATLALALALASERVDAFDGLRGRRGADPDAPGDLPLAALFAIKDGNASTTDTAGSDVMSHSSLVGGRRVPADVCSGLSP